MRLAFLAIVFIALASAVSHGFSLPVDSTQCVVGIADDWDSSRITLSIYEKRKGSWHQVHAPWSARIGRNGLAWGRGLHPSPERAKFKSEGDGRAPAGVFRIGGAWGYDKKIKKHPRLFYRQITPRDLWVEDSESPHYNQHLVLDHAPTSAWEKRAQMRQNDPAHSLKLFIAHNAEPNIQRGAGSAIFFHIWRDGGDRPTAGCTSMPEDQLRQLIAWIDPTQKPLYILLPKKTHQQHHKAWKLP